MVKDLDEIILVKIKNIYQINKIRVIDTDTILIISGYSLRKTLILEIKYIYDLFIFFWIASNCYNFIIF